MYIYLIVALAVLSRFVPHLPNFSPVYGALLFGGARLRKRDSIWFPLVLLAASDFVLTDLVYHRRLDWTELIQMGAFAAIAMIGWALRARLSLRRLTLACLAAPTGFFLVSNFGVWLGWRAYPATWAGLIQCYVAGLPFYGRSVGSTLLFAGVLFGIDELYRAKRGQRLHAQARAV